MMEHSEACALAQIIHESPEGRAFIDYVAHELCGIGRTIGTLNDIQMAAGVGRHNVGIELLDMLKEQG